MINKNTKETHYSPLIVNKTLSQLRLLYLKMSAKLDCMK